MKRKMKILHHQSYHTLMTIWEGTRTNSMKAHPPNLMKVLVHLQQVIHFVHMISHLMKQMRTLFIAT